MYLLLLLSTIFSYSSQSDGGITDLRTIRHSFHQSVLDENRIPEFYELAQSITSNSEAIQLAYKAAGYVMKAKSSSNPFTRIKLVMKYHNMIDQAVLQEPYNVEIRFLRFSIAYYLPDLLGFKKDIEEDKKQIIRNITHFDSSALGSDFNRYILWFVKETGFYNATELMIIRDHLSGKLALNHH